MDKAKLIALVASSLKSQQKALLEQLNQLQTDLTTESKSTAGDKHETGRAMIQLEIERLGVRLKRVEEQVEHFTRIDFSNNYKKAEVGALVETEDGMFLLGISFGVLPGVEVPTYGVSLQSPVGQAILGKKLGEGFHFNGKTVLIKSIT